MKNEKLDQVSSGKSRPGFSTRYNIAARSHRRLFNQSEQDQTTTKTTRRIGGANWQNH